MALLFDRNQVVLFKIESSKGVDANPTGADAILCDVVNPSIDGQTLENTNVRNSISKQPRRYTNTSLKASINVYVKGSGTAGTPPECAALLKACGHKESIDTTLGSEKVEYEPTSLESEMATGTLYIFKDGLKIKATGCMGNVKFSAVSGDFAKFTFDIEGVFAGVEDSPNPTPAYNETEPVESSNEGLTFGSWGDAVAREFGFDSGNSLVARNNINSATGLMPYIITERDPQWNAKIEAVLEATNSFWQAYETRETVSISITHGSIPGNIVEFKASAANFDDPAFNSENSLNMYDLSGQLLESHGNANYKLTFK